MLLIKNSNDYVNGNLSAWEVKENKNVTKHRRQFCYIHYKIRVSLPLKMHAPLSMIKSS